MIQSIRLRNWRSHKDSLLEFKKGTNVLVGVMGSGKTSVVDGICFGLFGTFPALNTRKVSIEETLMQKPQIANSASVELAFSYNNKNFSVERSIFKGSKATEAKLYCEGKLIAGPKPSEVTERIEKELEVDFDLFSRAVYSEQNQIDFFLRLSPRERKQKFDELLEINRYENARQNMQSVGNRVKKTLEDQKKWVNEQEKQFKAEETQQIRERMEKKKTEKMEWEQQAKKSGEKAIQIVEGIAELEKAEKELKKIRESELQTSAKIGHLEEQIVSSKQAIGNRPRTAMEQEAQQLEEAEKELLEEKKETGQTEKELEKKLRENLQEARVLESRIKELEKSLEQISMVAGKCPVCRKELHGHEKKEVEKEIENEQKKLRGQWEERKSEQKRIEAEQEKNGETDESNRKKLEKTREQKVRLEMLLVRANEIEKHLQQLENEKQKLSEIRERQKGIVFDEKQLSSQRQELIRFKTLEAEASREASACSQLAQALEENLKQLERIQSQLLELKQHNQQLEKTVEKIALFTNSLLAVQAILRESMLEAINDALHSIWQKVYPYADFESCRLAIQEGDYEIMAKSRNGEWVRVEGNLSGGERSTVALCIRMAFSLVLTRNLGWLILDEPTHNLDSLAVQELAQLLKNQLPELVEQTFVITHDKQMELAASGSLYEIVRDKNNDGISLPEAKSLY